MQSYDHLFKVIVIGNSNVGKSSLLLRYTEGGYAETTLPTIGVDFKIKSITLNNKRVKLQIWDTAGQERYKGITANYYKGAHGIMLIYDITDMKSFNDVNLWLEGRIFIENTKKEINKYSDQDVSKILVGNKGDLEDKRMVRSQMALEYAKYKQMAFIETSAKNTDNVDESFQMLCELIGNKKPEQEKNKRQHQQVGVKVSEQSEQQNKSTGCC